MLKSDESSSVAGCRLLRETSCCGNTAVCSYTNFIRSNPAEQVDSPQIVEVTIMGRLMMVVKR